MINKNIKNYNKDFSYISFYKDVPKTSKKIAIIPNVGELAREMTSKSQIGIIIDRVLKLKPVDWLSLGKNNIVSFPHLLRKDFATGVKILCELEVLRSRKKHYILHNQFVDMAVALNNKKVLVNFLKLSECYSFTPGVVTYNIGPFIKYLSSINNVPDNISIYTPLNPKKYNINPNIEDVEEYLETSDLDIVGI